LAPGKDSNYHDHYLIELAGRQDHDIGSF
jgi:hypothetical protein